MKICDLAYYENTALTWYDSAETHSGTPFQPALERRVLTYDLWAQLTPTDDGFRAAVDGVQTWENRRRRCRWRPTGECHWDAARNETWRYLSDTRDEMSWYNGIGVSMPSVLWRCRFGGRKGIRPVKKLSGGVLAWLSVWQGADLHMAQLTPLPLTVSCFSKIQIGFTFLVPAHLGSPGQMGR